MNRTIVEKATTRLSPNQRENQSQIAPGKVWEHLSPQQQHQVFQNLVCVCRHLAQINHQEEDES
jgi:hypothetical protein